MLDRLLGHATLLSRVAVWIGGALLIFAAALTTVDVFLRKIFNWSFGGADEIAGYMFAIAIALAYAHTMLNRANVRIDALYLVLPRRVRLILDVVGFLLLGGFLTLIMERAHDTWWNSFQNSSVSITPLVTPLALPQGFWFGGMVFFFLVFLLLLARVAMAIYQKDWMKISELIGARSLEEEVEEEKAHAAAELAREHELRDRSGDD